MLRNLEGIVNFNAEISDSALEFSVAEQKLASAYIAGFLVDQRYLGAAEAVSAVTSRIETDSLRPLIDQSGVLTRADVASGPAPTWEQPVV